MRHVSYLFVTLLLTLIVLGCSGSPGSPVSPDPNGSGSAGAMVTPQPGDYVTPGGADNSAPDLTEANTHPLQGQPLQGSHALWGLYEFALNPEADTLEIVPLRAGTLHLNALKFLEPGGEPGMVQLVGGLNWNSDKTKLDIDIRLTHPFPSFPQFSGFDVKGILITKGDFTGLSDPDLVMAGPSYLHLLNADGFTRWWNPVEFQGNTIFAYTDGALGMKDSKFHFLATLNGFKYFCDTLNKDDAVELLDTADRGAFRSTSSNIRHYSIAVPSFPSSLLFNYAIDASWEPPVTKPPVIPDDFPPEANQPEPWRIVSTETLNTIYYDALIGEQGGQLDLSIAVYDWQNPSPSPAGTINRVVAEWPNLFAPTEAEFVSNQGDYALWKLTLEPIAGALSSTDDISYLIWAESSDGAGYGGILDPDDALIAANSFGTGVLPQKVNTPPQVTSGVDGNPSPGLVTETYTVLWTDPDTGDTITVLWSVEPLGDPYLFDEPGNGDGTIDINWADYGFGAFTVQAQVSDGVNPPVEATALDVMVGNIPPIVGPIMGPTDVTAADTAAKYTATAFDPDQGQTLTYMWSFVLSGDPASFIIPGDPGDGSLTIDFSNVDPDIYEINVQVSDGFDLANGLPIIVTHSNTPPTVGQVDGKTPVTSADINELYQAPWSDPDKTQTISFLWSVVPDGDPESFTLPSNPDGSINIDWSTHPVGSYSVNVMADDGIAQTVGTALTVMRENILPTAGDVSGPTPVSSADTGSVYIAPIADADPDQVLTALWSVVPTGGLPNYVIASEPDLSVIIDWSVYSDGYYDVNVRADDGFAQVEGTLLTVHKFDNKQPSVGAVTGPVSVDHSTTDAQYSAPISDPEGDPLTVFWSVVPHGTPASYTIPGDDVTPLTVDWSTYPNLGDYDINVQVDDGFNPPVEGTLLTVSLLNTLPSVGSVSGPGFVDGFDIDANYTAAVSDIDPTQTLTILWSVVPTGAPPIYALPDLGGGSIDIDWSVFQVGDYDVNLQVSDGVGTVEGTLYAVHRMNTAPVVGQVAGDTSVDCTDTASHYAAPIDHPDPGQSLTIFWSIVKPGDPHKYLIPANGDGSLDINWSTVPVGSYAVNLQVSDGFATVEGTELVIERLNTLPVAGAVTGPAMVTQADTEHYYVNPPTTDCDIAQTLEFAFSIVPQGNPPDYSIPAATDAIDIDWSGYAVGTWTIGCSAYDGYGYGYATPLDVIVALPPCEGTAHSYLGIVIPNHYSVAALSILPRGDVAFLNEGVSFYGGLGLAQVGPHTLGVFNADNTGATTVTNTYNLGTADAVISIDTSPVDSRVLIVTASQPTLIKILDADTIFGDPIDGVIDTGNSKITWVAVDIEADGDFWAVQRDTTSATVYRLVRYTHLVSSPYYQYDATGTRDITPQTGTNTDIFDIAINQQSSMLYLLEAGPVSQGTMQTYLVLDGFQAVFMGTLGNALFSQPLDFEAHPLIGFARYGDIEIDHMNAADEKCRILLYGRLADGSSELIRMDSSYNTLDVENHSAAWPAFSINTDSDPSTRNLIMPDAGNLAYWQTPFDW